MTKKSLIKAGSYKNAKTLFRAIDNKTRLKILSVLEDDGKLTVSQVSEKIGLVFAMVSLHLTILKKHRLVLSSKGNDARQNVYFLNKEKIKFVNQICEDITEI